MEFINEPYKVYAKPNDFGYITAVNSSAFLTDITGWVEIDSGYSDKHHHAQGNYFPESVMTMSGAYRYKLMDGIAVECTPEEIVKQETNNITPVTPTIDERLSAMEVAMLEMMGVSL